MFPGAFGFVVARAPAAFRGEVAVYLGEQGVSAIGDAAFDDAEGAAFAGGGSGFPMLINGECADLSKPGGGEIAERFEEEASDAGGGSRNARSRC